LLIETSALPLSQTVTRGEAVAAEALRQRQFHGEARHKAAISEIPPRSDSRQANYLEDYITGTNN